MSSQHEFMEKVEVTPEECWEWRGGSKDNGWGLRYGYVGSGKSREYAHRVSYRVFRGEIPEGLQIDHLCRNTLCVNPDHLEAVTARENTLRGTSPAALNSKKTCCGYGHPLALSNLYIEPKTGKRHCRTCRNRIRRAHYQNNRAQQIAASVQRRLIRRNKCTA